LIDHCRKRERQIEGYNYCFQIQHAVVQNVTKNDTAIEHIALQGSCAMYINSWQDIRAIDAELCFGKNGLFHFVRHLEHCGDSLFKF